MDGTEVTLHHLLSHTSGLPSPGGTDGYKAAVWRRTITPAEQIDFVKALPLVRKPGSAYAYENYNFLLAAYVVREDRGQTLRDVPPGALLHPARHERHRRGDARERCATRRDRLREGG